jgi:NAD(P)H-dependent FMN reductase
MISIISGSARPKSNTIKVARSIAKILAEHNQTFKIIDFNQFDIPNFNQPFNPQNLTEWQKETVESLSQSTHIIWVTPEYNWLPSAEVMQFINRLGTETFKAIWDNKTFATVGISVGIGGRMPAVTLKNVLDKIIDFMQLNSKTVAAIQEVHFTSNVIEEDGTLKDNERFNQSFKSFVNGVISK